MIFAILGINLRVVDLPLSKKLNLMYIEENPQKAKLHPYKVKIKYDDY